MYKIRTSAERKAEVAKLPGLSEKQAAWFLRGEQGEDVRKFATSLRNLLLPVPLVHGAIDYAQHDVYIRKSAFIDRVCSALVKRLEREDAR